MHSAPRCKECSEGQFAPDKTQSIADGPNSDFFPNKKTEQEIYDGFGLNSNVPNHDVQLVHLSSLDIRCQ